MGKSNWTPEHECLARKAQCNLQENGTICQKMPIENCELDTRKRGKGYQYGVMARNRSHTVRKRRQPDFYKVILLVEGQLKEFVIDTVSPVTIIPPLITPKEIQQTTNCFVDVNKNQ